MMCARILKSPIRSVCKTIMVVFQQVSSEIHMVFGACCTFLSSAHEENYVPFVQTQFVLRTDILAGKFEHPDVLLIATHALPCKFDLR